MKYLLGILTIFFCANPAQAQEHEKKALTKKIRRLKNKLLQLEQVLDKSNNSRNARKKMMGMRRRGMGMRRRGMGMRRRGMGMRRRGMGMRRRGMGMRRRGMGMRRRGMGMRRRGMRVKSMRMKMKSMRMKMKSMRMKMKGMPMMGKPPHKSLKRSSLPGFPGLSHLYHIGSSDFFLDHAKHIKLTNKQKVRLNRLKEKILLKIASYDRKIDQAEQSLWKLTSMDRPQSKKIRATIQEIEKLRGEKRFLFIHAVGHSVQVLNNRQRRLLSGLSEKERPTTSPTSKKASRKQPTTSPMRNIR